MSTTTHPTPDSDAPTHRYLIAYIDNPRGQAGAAEVTRHQPIRDSADVDAVTDVLRNHKNTTTLMVTGFSRFEEDQ